MSDRIDLKEIERRAYLSYHEDGLVDILVGICLFIASLYACARMVLLSVIIMVSGYLQFQSFKRKYPIVQEI